MDERGIAAVCGKFGCSRYSTVVCNDGVTFRVACAARVANDTRAVSLMRISLGNRTGNEVHARVLSVEKNFKISSRLLAALSEEPLTDIQLCTCGQGGAGGARGVIHAAELRGVHFQYGALCERGFRYGVNAAFAAAAARTDMLFQIHDVSVPSQKKPVDSVVAGGFSVVVCTPQPATMVTSAPSPTKKSL